MIITMEFSRYFYFLSLFCWIPVKNTFHCSVHLKIHSKSLFSIYVISKEERISEIKRCFSNNLLKHFYLYKEK